MRFVRIGRDRADERRVKGFVDDCQQARAAHGDRWRACRLRYPGSDGWVIADDSGQPTGAFKLRGAAVAIGEIAARSSRRTPRIAVASSGNFGLAAASVARDMGIPVRVFTPSSVARTKVERLELLGADVQAEFPDYETAKAEAMHFAESDGARYLDGASRDVLRGNGSLALEWADSGRLARRSAAILVPLGLGSLAVPTALVLRELGYEFDLWAIEAATHCKLLAAHHPGVVPTGRNTIADGAAISELPPGTERLLGAHVDAVVALDEDEICAGMRVLRDACGVRAEGAGALAAAAYIAAPGLFHSYRQIWTVLSGRNVEPDRFDRAVALVGG